MFLVSWLILSIIIQRSVSMRHMFAIAVVLFIQTQHSRLSNLHFERFDDVEPLEYVGFSLAVVGGHHPTLLLMTIIADWAVGCMRGN